MMAKTLEAEVLARLQQQSDTYLLEISRMFFERLGDVKTIANDPLLCVDNVSTQRLSARLVSYRNISKVYLSLSFFANDGVRRADSSGLGIGNALDPQSFLGRRWQTALQSVAFFGAGRSTSMKEDVIYFTNKVQCVADQEPRGMVVARIALTQLHNLFTTTTQTARNFSSVKIHLLDKNDLLLYSNNAPKEIMQPHQPHDNRPDHLVVNAHSMEYMDFKGTDWSLQLSIAKDIALGPAIKLWDRIAVLTLVGIGVAVLLALFFSLRFIKPIHTLVAAARDVASGNLSARANAIKDNMEQRVPAESNDELVILAQAFDQMVMDLYQQKSVLEQTADELLSALTRLSLATEAARIGIWVWNMDGHYLEWDERMHVLYGVAPGTNLTFKTWTDALHPEDREVAVMQVQDAMQGNTTFATDFRIVLPDGCIRTIRAAGLVETHTITGAQRRMVGVNWDITEQKQAESTLLQAKEMAERMVEEKNKIQTQLKDALELNQKIFANTNHGIIAFLATTGQCVIANPAAELMIGAKSADLLQQNFRNLESWRRSGLLELAEETLATGQDQEGEFQFVTTFGKDLWWHAYFTSFISQATTHLLLITNDVAERKQAEMGLLQAKHEAESANQSKSKFLANMSHEIRTPMNAVVGFTDLALQLTSQPRMRDYLSKIATASRCLLRIINDILDFSKIEAGKLELEMADFFLRDVFANLADMFRSQAAEKHLELIFCVVEECLYQLHGDALRLEQVLLNLISNAIKFTDKGEVEIQVKTRRESVDQVTLEFSVRDTGIGMTGEQSARLFHAFTQADSTTTRRFGGTGLGLSICQQLVEIMAGRIWVDSNTERGSVFCFTATFQRKVGAEAIYMVPAVGMERLKTLVVDDNRAARKALQRVLGLFDFEVTGVGSGEEALTAIQQSIDEAQPFQLAIVDCLMPVMDGIETIQQIKQITTTESTPKIILQLPYDREEEITAQEEIVGVDVYLTKPINCSILFDTTMELFDKKVIRAVRAGTENVDLTQITQCLGGARVLLVEDAPINQQVAGELLERVGIHVDIANNGAEAVAMVERNDYAAVLMDIQMPIMDGYDATRAIRANARFAQLPIIAMTAHALADERTKCLAAGMNDHIGKPIDSHHLFAVLVGQLKANARVAVAETPVLQINSRAEGAMPTNDVIPGIDMTAAMKRVMGNKTLLINLLLEFQRDYINAAEEIRNAFTRGNVEQARKKVHEIKGVAGNIGAHQVHKAAHDLELAVQQRRPTDWPVLTTTFVARLREIMTVIATLQPLGEPAQTVATPCITIDQSAQPDLAILQPRLIELSGYLAKFDLESIASFNAIKPVLLQAGFRQEVEEMEQKLDIFDFQGTLTLVQSIAQSLDILLPGTS